jgi:serine phosphatase RsbU (regulator of sigma subunit)
VIGLPPPAADAAPARLLVVDDDPSNRDLLARRLTRLGHQVVAAATGAAGLDAAATGGIDVVLLDVMLPDISGYEVLARLREGEGTRDVPVIMISALDEVTSISRCIELGAEDYLAKPFDPLLLRARVGACLAKKRLRDRERLYARSLERELEIGREIQQGFLPEVLPQPPGWEVAAHFRPARMVGGDFYDAFPLDGDRLLGLAIADVCDKGVGAALFMALFRTLLRAFAAQGAPGAAPTERARAAVVATNDYIARTHGATDMFATIFFGVLDVASGELAYVNGGHEPPLLASSGGGVMRLAPTGPALGVFPGAEFATARVVIAPGGALLAYTDGVTEARGGAPGGAGDGSFFGERALEGCLAWPPDPAAALVARITAALDAHVGDVGQSDDRALLVVRRG